MEGIGVCGCCAFYTMYKNIQYGADRPDSMSARGVPVTDQSQFTYASQSLSSTRKSNHLCEHSCSGMLNGSWFKQVGAHCRVGSNHSHNHKGK